MSKLETIEATGRQVWLAGLGVYGAGWKYAIGKFDQTFTKSNQLINELIATGETVESKLKQKLPKVEPLNIEARLATVKQKLGLNKDSEASRIEQLTAKVDALTAAVAQLANTDKKPARKAKSTTKVSVKKSAK